MSATSALEDITNSGVFVGYNKQVNDWVFGGESAYTFGDIPTTLYSTSLYSGRLDLKARGGHSFGRAMVYGVVGYSFTEFDDNGSLFPSSGINYGGGVDALVSRNCADLGWQRDSKFSEQQFISICQRVLTVLRGLKRPVRGGYISRGVIIHQGRFGRYFGSRNYGISCGLSGLEGQSGGFLDGSRRSY